MQHDVFPLEQQEIFLKKIYQLFKNIALRCNALLGPSAPSSYRFLEQLFKNIQTFGSFSVFQGIFRPVFRTNVYDV